MTPNSWKYPSVRALLVGGELTKANLQGKLNGHPESSVMLVINSIDKPQHRKAPFSPSEPLKKLRFVDPVDLELLE